jgi:hypothetical protein
MQSALWFSSASDSSTILIVAVMETSLCMPVLVTTCKHLLTRLASLADKASMLEIKQLRNFVHKLSTLPGFMAAMKANKSGS